MVPKHPDQPSSNLKLLTLALLGILTIVVIPIVSFTIFFPLRLLPNEGFKTIAGEDLAMMKGTDLSDEKLRQEILKISDERQQKYLNLLASYGSFITALVAVSGVIITIWRTSSEIARQRSLDRQQRQDEQDHQKAESLRRLHEKFALTVTALGAEQAAIRASAAVSLLSFLRPESSSLYEQVYWVLLANLKVKHDDEINRLLVRAFEKAVRLQLQQSLEENCPFEIPLAHTHLNYINLSDLNLSQTNLLQKTRDAPSQVDLGFADLEYANLVSTRLQRTRGIEVNLRKARLSNTNLSEARLQHADLEKAILHGANLVAADLKHANLKGAQFQQAKLQSAHLSKTDLRGARFEQAYLGDTHFLELNPHPGKDVLKSILKARDWEKAHFSPAMENELFKMSEILHES